MASALLIAHYDAFGSTDRIWAIIGWGMEITLTTALTIAIAGRLWILGRRSRSAGGRYTYHATVYTILESGGTIACATLVCYIFLLKGGLNDVTTLSGTGSLTQLAVRPLWIPLCCLTHTLTSDQTMMPLIIIVRISLNITHGQNRVATAADFADVQHQPTPASGIHQAHVSTVESSDSYQIEVFEYSDAGFLTKPDVARQLSSDDIV